MAKKRKRYLIGDSDWFWRKKYCPFCGHKLKIPYYGSKAKTCNGCQRFFNG